MIVDEKSAPANTSYQGTDYHFRATYCKEAFEKEPQNYNEGAKNLGKTADPVCGMTIEIPHAAAMSVYQGQFVYFCNVSCKEKFDVSPEKFLKKQELPAKERPSLPPTAAGFSGIISQMQIELIVR